jgi:hypothetical protein
LIDPLKIARNLFCVLTTLSTLQPHDRRAPATLGRTGEREALNARIARQKRVHRGAQGADPLAVDDPYARDAFFQTKPDVIRNQFAQIRRAEGMQVQFAFDLEFNGIWIGVCYGVSPV